MRACSSLSPSLWDDQTNGDRTGAGLSAGLDFGGEGAAAGSWRWIDLSFTSAAAFRMAGRNQAE
jgi:hypothetical protein